MGAARCAMSISGASLVPKRKVPGWSKDFRRGIWYEPWSQLAPNRACTSGAFWCEPLAPSTSRPDKGVYRGSAIASVRRCIAVMAISTQKEPGMPTPPNPSEKERPFLPRMNDGDILARLGEEPMVAISLMIEGQNGLSWPHWKRLVAEVE